MTLDYHSAVFLKSASKLEQCPHDDLPEASFCGRSNAGKSSAINALTGQRKLARTSKTPGRTQLFNFFSLPDGSRLVDLPGYGYAKVPISLKEHWHNHLDDYLRNRETLKGLVLLMDIRHPLKDFDHMMLEWSTQAEVPLHILLTKADKLKRGAQKNTFFSVKKSIPAEVTLQLFSSPEKSGVDELTEILDSWLEAKKGP